MPNHKTFEYKPRYFDPEKEAREARNEMIKEEMGLKKEKEYKPNIRGKFTGLYDGRQKIKEKNKNLKKIIYVITIALIIIIFYFTFKLMTILFHNV